MTTPILEPETRQDAQGDSAKRFGWITITVAIVGGMVVAGTLTSAVFNNLRDVMRAETTITQSVSGVSSLRVDVESVGMQIQFGDVSEAELRVETRGFKPASEWQLVAEGGELSVERASGSRGGAGFGDEELSLTLPKSIEGEDLDAQITVSSGAATVEGDFGDVVLETSSGASNFDGSAANLTATTGSGASNIDAEVAGEVVLSASSGALNVELGDVTPKSTEISLESGFASVSMPDGPYKVEKNLSESGSADISVRQSDTAKNTLSISVGSGYVTIE
ncbi:hypothetical protein C5B85_10980 [Pseudoclavibacter sp. AY1F1]|uniref:DUF4097 family beta strand repeat-containing protein n=1 Tax=Pseudoclavibacter sp. AY1F1 TaxID=2080583 RepID=UPI000CE7C062|nr:DUF4097 family beta strand repeat-containing protein [Pseudoclavibacter sp. AY1F1]PPF44162.1 hypothetical protein C5B85_10980 [Pseudoclavibacter sp. AY1F1]